MYQQGLAGPTLSPVHIQDLDGCPLWYFGTGHKQYGNVSHGADHKQLAFSCQKCRVRGGVSVIVCYSFLHIQAEKEKHGGGVVS